MPEFRLGRFARKELREILRDRRTVLTLVLMPLLLYPLLAVAFRQFFLTSLVAANPPPVRVALASPDEGSLLIALLWLGTPEPDGGPPRIDPTLPPPPGFDLFVTDKLEGNLREHDIDVVARLPQTPELDLRNLFYREPGPAPRPLRVVTAALPPTVRVELVAVEGS